MTNDIPEFIYYTPPNACDVPFNGTVQFTEGNSKQDIKYRIVPNIKPEDSIIPKIPKEDWFLDVSRYYYYWPTDVSGMMPAHNLREIADELDRRNKPLNDSLTEYFKK